MVELEKIYESQAEMRNVIEKSIVELMQNKNINRICFCQEELDADKNDDDFLVPDDIDDECLEECPVVYFYDEDMLGEECITRTKVIDIWIRNGRISYLESTVAHLSDYSIVTNDSLCVLYEAVIEKCKQI